MASEMLSDFIDIEGLKKQQSEMMQVFQTLSDEMTKLQTQAIGVFKGLADVSSLEKLVNLTSQSAKANEGAIASLEGMKSSITQLNEVQMKLNMTTKDRIEMLKQQAIAEMAPIGSITKMRAELALLNKEYEALNKQKQVGREADLKGAIAAKESQINTARGVSTSPIQMNMGGNIQQLIEGKEAVLKYETQIKSLNDRLENGKIKQEQYYTQMGIATERLMQAKLSVNEYTQAVNAEIKATEMASTASKQLAAETMTNKLEITEYNVALKKQIQLQGAVPGSIAEARIQSQMWRKELNNLNLTTDEGIAKQKELIAMIGERDAFIGKNVDKYTQRKINIGNYPDASAQLTQINAEMQQLAATGQQDSVVFGQLAEKANEIKMAMGGVSGELNLITKQLQLMAEAGKHSSAEFQAMTARAQQLRGVVAEVKQMNTGLTSVTGSSTLTQQLAATKYEMQKLAVAGKIGSEEFKILTAQAQRLQTTLNEVNQSAKVTGSTLEKIGGRVNTMFLRMFVHMAIFQTIMDAFERMKDTIVTAYDRINFAQVATEDAAKELANSFTKEAIAIEAMRARFNAAGESMQNKKEIVKELNDAIKDQYHEITKVSEAEDFFKNKSSAFIEALTLRAQAQANLTALTKEYEKQIINDADPEALLGNYKKAVIMIEAIGKAVKNQEPVKNIMQNYDQFKADRAFVAAGDESVNSLNKQQVYLQNIIDLQNKANEIDNKNKFKTDDVNKDKKSGKDTLAADLAAQYKAEKEFNDATAELAKLRLQHEADTQQAIFDNDKISLDARLGAYAEYEKKIIGIEQIEGGKQIADLEAKQKELLAKNEAYQKGRLKLNEMEANTLFTEMKTNQTLLEAATERHNNKLALIAIQGVTKRQNILTSSNETTIKQSEDTMQNGLMAIEQSYETEKQLLDKQLKSKAISIKEYEESMKKLRYDYDMIELETKKSTYLAELNIANLSAEQIAAINKNLAAVIREMHNKESARDMQQVQEDFAEKKKVEDELKKLHEAGFELGMTAMNAYYQKELDYQQKVLDNIQKEKTAKQDAINTAFASEQRKAIATKILNEQVAQQEKQIAAEMARIKREQAIADRVAAILKVIEQTAIAEIGVIAAAATMGPEGIAYAATMEPLVSGIGAAQIAAILAAPMPKYADGTGTGTHPGGPALIGEEYKPEMIIEPGKEPYFVDSPTVKNLPKGTRVIPEADLVRGSENIGIGDAAMQLWAINLSIEGAIKGSMSELKDEVSNLTDVVKNKRENYISIDANGIKRMSKIGNSWTTYLDSNFN